MLCVTWNKKYIADDVLLQHSYIAFKDTYTISYITRVCVYSRLIVQNYQSQVQRYNKTNCLYNIKYTQSEQIYIKKINIK